jgi:hypothetical protein
MRGGAPPGEAESRTRADLVQFFFSALFSPLSDRIDLSPFFSF